MLYRISNRKSLAAPDRDLLTEDAPRSIGDDGAKYHRHRPGRPCATGSAACCTDTAPRPLADRRATVRQLLVASPRARDLVGRTRVDSLSEIEVEAILVRFTAAGLLPPDQDKE